MSTYPHYETLLCSKANGVAYITLNRPKQLNALSAQTIQDLTDAFQNARDDQEISGVILTGTGDRAFIAGADINELAHTSPIQAITMIRTGQDLFDFIENLGKPVIAAVNGLALGGGCEIAMACTLRLASDNAMFGQPEVKLGIIPGYGGTQRLPRLVGKGRALQLILTGDMINAAEAHRIGLVNEIVAPADLIHRAEAILAKIAANAPLAVRLAMQSVHSGSQTSQAEGLRLEGALFALCAATEDRVEGTSAFLEKRPAKFKGR
jgi:enoyl-CoA hydratase